MVLDESGGLMPKGVYVHGVKHGHNRKKQRSKEYQCWAGMIQRCLNPNYPGRKNYGGRGISVCERWRRFDNFLRDMGKSPDHTTLGRVNNELGYEPTNCRWETREQQANNKRTSRLIEHAGAIRTMSQWAKEIEILPNTLLYRIKRGWSINRALGSKS